MKQKQWQLQQQQQQQMMMMTIVTTVIVTLDVATFFPVATATATTTTTTTRTTTLIINNTVDGSFYAPILDEVTQEWIGEKYQDLVYDKETGIFLGINQGYAFNFDDDSKSNIGGLPLPPPYISNDVVYLQDRGGGGGGDGSDVIVFLNDYIVLATGEQFGSYMGGHVEEIVLQSDPVYISELVLTEPPSRPLPLQGEDSDGEGDDANASVVNLNSTTSFHITSEGGFYFQVSQPAAAQPDTGTTEQIGQLFQNPAFVPQVDNNAPNVSITNDTVIGINQGYSYQFPNEALIPDVPGLTGMSENIMGNRYFVLDEGNIIVINEAVIHGSGIYSKYSGTSLVEQVLSTDPNWVSKITLQENNDIPATTGGYVSNGTRPYDFRVTSEGGWYNAFLDPISGEQTGEQFQNPVYDAAGTRIGTNQGYGFNFPPSYMNLTQVWQGNRVFHLEGGTITFYGQAIVAASGDYKAYAGGTYKEVTVSQDPDYVSEITLMPLSTNNGSGSTSDDQQSGSGSSSNIFCFTAMLFVPIVCQLT